MKPDATSQQLFAPVFQAIERHGLSEIQPPLTVEPVEYRTLLYSRLARVLIRSASGATPAYVKIIRLKNDSAEHLETMRARIRKEFEMAAAMHRMLAGESRIFSIRPLGAFRSSLPM